MIWESTRKSIEVDVRRGTVGRNSVESPYTKSEGEQKGRYSLISRTWTVMVAVPTRSSAKLNARTRRTV